MIVSQVEFLIKMLLISCRQKMPLRMNYNYTHDKSWNFFFWERLIASNLQYIWFFSCWFVHSKKSQKLEAAFRFWHFKPNIMIKCRVECQSLTNPKSQKLQLNSVQCDWQLKRKLLERNSTKNLKPVYLSLWGKATRKFWLVSHRMCHQQFMPKIAASMILALHNSHLWMRCNW